ncbi:phosphoenolpyruvate--protein phosphotransferase [Sphingomonas sp. HDW15A]|uniref:phosphoenolpyruvate--protein phosphotransferase n=1 Tax=Sphingomonas sp. HDW15A TaxID=2714942 RepID=UPI00140C26D7|nr:phosphoenolpyruvate--protein phosphotransferase [Sphingomonas sp. HDW15A]QIK96676.1 phosphoenolpyruvate--protein phosphotransferase [Sphingomonas sp. HDW15A]
MPLTAASASREIIVGLHDVMAKRMSAQAKLNTVVDLIANKLRSEVCSIYLLHDGKLELYATHGLRVEAVHVTRLSLSEGLVGTIAAEGRILNLDEAASHPAFAYRPETGEERFHSFAGVPIVRRENAIGVLAVQHAEPRCYEDIEIEALQTVAMVLSEMIVNARLADGGRRGRGETGAQRIAGLKLVTGMAKGVAVFHQPRVVVEHTVADDIEAERARVYSAFRRMREQIDHMTRDAEFGTIGEHNEILETYKMFAYDEGWSRRINEAIDSGLTAEAAIERVQQRTRARMQDIDDPLLKERMHDLEDLSNRLLRIVSGRMGTAAKTGLQKDTVLIARNLGPAELLEYDRRRLKAVVLEEGSLTAHMTIVARAMGVPVVGKVEDIRHVASEGDPILVDGDNATIVVRPTRALTQAFEQRMAMSQKRRAQYATLKNQPAITTDGARISLMVNAGLAEDAAMLEASGAEGIGLFRTEFQFLVSAALPGRQSQLKLYRSVLDLAGEKPVVFRTVDIGGDKALPYLADARDEAENPAMGWRALRLSLERATLMKAQARALLEAASGRTLNVMFPMVSEPWEYEEARALFEEQVEWAKKSRKPVPKAIRYGAMLEVPSLAEMLDVLLPRLDFLSIGTNDLTQFLFAADRADPRLADRYDWLSPAILRFLKRVSDQAVAAGVPVRVCGEMGGRPLEAMALIGIGIRNFSITPAAVGPVKAMVRAIDAQEVTARVGKLIAAPAPDLRKRLSDWAKRHRIPLG